MEDRDAHMLARFLHWSYGVKAGLYLSDGTLACVSATGLRQGDPLGPLFFALGYMHILRAAAARFTRTTFVAFIDDTYFICARSLGPPILIWLSAKLSGAGMTLNRSKGCCLDPSPGAPEGVQEDGSTVTGDGIKVLGGPVAFGRESPVGGNSFRADYYESKLRATTRVLELIPRPENHTAYLLVAQCVNARPSYLCRIVGPWTVSRFLGDFNARIDECIQKIAGLQNPLPEWSKVIRGLPAKQSGACVRRLRDSAASAYCAAFLKASGIIRLLFPLVWKVAWAAGPEVVGLQTAIMGRTIPYFGRFTSAGPCGCGPRRRRRTRNAPCGPPVLALGDPTPEADADKTLR